MENVAGKKIDTEKSLIEHYSSLKLQASQEREVTEEGIRSTQSAQLISALDKTNQLMKFFVLQPKQLAKLNGRKSLN